MLKFTRIPGNRNAALHLVTTSALLLCLWAVGIRPVQAQIIWDPPMSVAPPSVAHNWPRITTDGNGDPVILWGNAERVMFARWTGSGFSPGIALNPSGMTIAEASWMGPELAAHGDTLYAVFKETPENLDGKAIWCVHSYDGGRTWSDPVKVDDIGTDKGRFPVVITDSEGHPVVGFMRFDAQFRDPHWVVARSQDHGKTFLPDSKASGWSGARSEVCDCCPGSMHSSGERIALFYRDNLENLRECWVGLSTDRGYSFSSGMNMDSTGWRINSCPSSAIDGVILGDSVYSAFMSGAEGAGRVYFSRAAFGGSGGKGKPIVPVTPDIRSQNYPRMDGQGRALGVVWAQYTGDRWILPVLFTPEISSGNAFFTDTVGMGNIENADIAVTDNHIFVVWKDGGSRNIRFRSGTWQTINSNTEQLPIENLSVFPNPSLSQWTLSAQYPGKYTLDISVIDVKGQIVKFTPIEGFGQLQLDIDGSGLPAGDYFLRIKDQGGKRSYTIPIVKM